MAGSINIPENLKYTFNRLIQRLPSKKKDDPALQNSILQFLKLGGERLAMARIQPILHPFPEDISVVKPRPLASSPEGDDIEDIDENDENDESDGDDDDDYDD